MQFAENCSSSPLVVLMGFCAKHKAAKTLCFVAETVRDRKCRTSQVINASLLLLVLLFVLQETQTTMFEMSKMEWWRDGGMEGSEEGADRENRHTHRKTINRILFFLYHRTEQTPSGGGRRECDAVWFDPGHYELCKPWFVHKMGVKRRPRRRRVPFIFYCLFVFIFLRSIFWPVWL